MRRGSMRCRRRISTKTTDPLRPRPPSSPSVFIKPSKWLAFICSCDVSVKPAGSGKMIDVRSIPLGTKGAIDGPIGAEERTGPKRSRERKRREERRGEEKERKNDVDPRGVSWEREGETADEERGDLRAREIGALWEGYSEGRIDGPGN